MSCSQPLLYNSRWTEIPITSRRHCRNVISSMYSMRNCICINDSVNYCNATWTVPSISALLSLGGLARRTSQLSHCYRFCSMETNVIRNNKTKQKDMKERIWQVGFDHHFIFPITLDSQETAFDATKTLCNWVQSEIRSGYLAYGQLCYFVNEIV